MSQNHLSKLLSEIRSQFMNEDADFTLKIDSFPSLKDLYPKLGEEIIEDEFTPFAGANESFKSGGGGMFLHSSGSTGFPKPIKLSKPTLASYVRMRKCLIIVFELPFDRLCFSFDRTCSGFTR
jgi:hypothetical protein